MFSTASEFNKSKRINSALDPNVVKCLGDGIDPSIQLSLW
jgi:hypothetical protein